MGDYPSKEHVGGIHKHVRPYYLHMENSPQYLERAAKPSSRRGCDETLGDPYHKQVPLPRIPDYRDLERKPVTATSVERKRDQRMSQLGRARLKRQTDMLQRFTSELEQ